MHWMSFKLKASNKAMKLIQGTSLAIAGSFLNIPAFAFIPYVYVPNPEGLNKTGVEIKQTTYQLLQLRQFNDARRLAKLGVQVNPHDKDLWILLAEAQINNSLIEKAKFSLNKAKLLDPTNANIWVAEASLAIRQNKPKIATKFAQKGIKLDPKNFNAYFHLGNARIMENKFIIAIEAFEKAYSIKPLFWQAINNKGIVLFELNKTNEAIETWRKVLKIEMNSEPMLALAAGLNEKRPGNIEALELASKALKKNPNYVSLNHQKEQLWGPKLRRATKKLFMQPSLKTDIERAIATADTN